MKTSQFNKRAERAMMRRNLGTPGFCWSCDPARQVVHLAIHNGDGCGTSFTMDALDYCKLVTGLCAVEIDILPLTINRNYTPKMAEARDTRLAIAAAQQRNPEMTPEFIDRSAKAILRKHRGTKGGK